MARQLPPLKSLASFEAAARHCSFTSAANELNVTQSAISHQIRQLENILGVQLFNRQPRHLSLTEAAKILLPEITESLNRMDSIVGKVKQLRDNSANRLSIRVAPSFALAWLSPRLGEFWLKHPDIELCLFHSHAITNFDTENIDMGVAYGKGDWPGIQTELLLKLDFFPVCSPKLFDNKKTPPGLCDLKEYNLLHEVDYECWTRWIELAGMKDMNPYQGSIIDDTNVLVQAAIDGKGIALGSSIFVDPYLEDGSLIKLSDISMQNDDGYYVIYPDNTATSSFVTLFKDWIQSQT